MPKKPKIQDAEDKNLTSREDKFVAEMVNPEMKSAADAARKAGYSEKTARQTASENLTKPHILKAIEKRRAELLLFANANPAEIFGSALIEANLSVDDCINAKGQFDVKKARRTGAIHRVKKLTYDVKVVTTTDKDGVKTSKLETYVKSFEIADRSAARRELADYLGMKQMPQANQKTLEMTARNIIRAVQKFPAADVELLLKAAADDLSINVDVLREKVEELRENLTTETVQ